MLWTHDGAHVAASNGAGNWTVAEQAVELDSRTHDRAIDAGVASPSRAALAALGLGDATTTLVVRLSVRDEEQGVLVIQSTARRPPDVLDSLEALASQASLALEAASLAENLHRQKSEARFRSLVAHSSDLITVIDETGSSPIRARRSSACSATRSRRSKAQRFDRLLAEADRSRLAADGQRQRRRRAGVAHLRVRAAATTTAAGCSSRCSTRSCSRTSTSTASCSTAATSASARRSRSSSRTRRSTIPSPTSRTARSSPTASRTRSARPSASGSLIAVMFIDLDDFKTVNDSLGHQAGDAILSEVARRLERAIRPADTVARFGGDEFAILLDGVSGSDEAALIADRLLTRARERRARSTESRSTRAPASASASATRTCSRRTPRSCSGTPTSRCTWRSATARARYRLFEPAMHERVVERLELRAELQQALELEQLEVYYQPVVRLGARRPTTASRRFCAGTTRRAA